MNCRSGREARVAAFSLASVVLGLFPAGGRALAATRSAGIPEGGPQWFESYRQAVIHAELEEWEAVERFVREALGANPTPRRNVRIYGMWHTSYTPFFHLGLAQYRQGRYDEAMKSFRREAAAGVIQHDPVAWLKMKKLMASARGGPPPPPGEVAPASAPEPASVPPAESPDGVIRGLEAFFKSDYDRSIAAFQEALKGWQGSEGGDLTLHLYLGMAYAGKASASPGQEKIWENLAYMEFQRVHRMDPGYRLSPGIFSEDMMALFESAGGGR